MKSRNSWFIPDDKGSLIKSVTRVLQDIKKFKLVICWKCCQFAENVPKQNCKKIDLKYFGRVKTIILNRMYSVLLKVIFSRLFEIATCQKCLIIQYVRLKYCKIKRHNCKMDSVDLVGLGCYVNINIM